jgi:hypothetical protein
VLIWTLLGSGARGIVRIFGHTGMVSCFFSYSIHDCYSCVAAVAQLVERVLGKDEVMGPSPISS